MGILPIFVDPARSAVIGSIRGTHATHDQQWRRLMRLFLAGLSALAVLVVAGSASASTAADQGDLLSEFSTTGAGVVAPMSASELGGIRGEGTFVKTFDFPNLHHDFDRMCQYRPLCNRFSQKIYILWPFQ